MYVINQIQIISVRTSKFRYYVPTQNINTFHCWVLHLQLFYTLAFCCQLYYQYMIKYLLILLFHIRHYKYKAEQKLHQYVWYQTDTTESFPPALCICYLCFFQLISLVFWGIFFNLLLTLKSINASKFLFCLKGLSAT